jgi:hypothetical protein
MVIGLALASVVAMGVVGALVARPAPPPPVVTPEPAPVVTRPALVEVEPPEVLIPPAPDAGIEVETPPSDVVETPPVSSAKRPKPTAPVYTGPIVTKKEAEQILKPELLACMKEHHVHYLITRLGNEPRGGTVPPLGLTGVSIVEYKPTPGFASTPLGRCVARVGKEVRAPAYRGNYIYFGLRQDAVPDPMADHPSKLDMKVAEQTLSARDDEARDCLTRNPAGSRPGESVKIAVLFEGATGRVSRVEPYYIEPKSPYGRCLQAVYGKATVEKFRAIEQRVLHSLSP